MIKGEGGALDRGKKSEASLESVGAKASRAAGGFGSSASGVGTLSDICLLTAAGAAGWIDVGWGEVGWWWRWGWLESWSIQPQTCISTNILLRKDNNNNNNPVSQLEQRPFRTGWLRLTARVSDWSHLSRGEWEVSANTQLIWGCQHLAAMIQQHWSWTANQMHDTV